ncbi:MAG: heavy-metal-associated domain-containing protein, partial [Peptococcaceae bacterium]
IMEKLMLINGMSCDHCKAAVEKALNAIGGVEAEVDLKQKTAAIKLTEAIDDQVLKNAVSKAGYEVVSVTNK